MTLLDEAERRLQESDFPRARDGYREAMLHEEPPAEALANLGIAEENESLLFRQELARRHPDSVSVRLELAGRLAQGRGARKALQLCDELLSSESGREAGFQIRQVRLNAAIACGEYEVAAEDFGYLLKTVNEQTSNHRFHYTLAAIIARLDDWRARTLIDLLQGMLPKPNPFEEILASKAAELAALSRLGNPPPMTEQRSIESESTSVTLQAIGLDESQRLVAIAALGMCQALKDGSVTPAYACQKLLGPALLTLLERQGAQPKLREAIHLATELEDVADLVPAKLADSITDIESALLDFLDELAPSSLLTGKWLAIKSQGKDIR